MSLIICSIFGGIGLLCLIVGIKLAIGVLTALGIFLVIPVIARGSYELNEYITNRENNRDPD